MFSGIWSGIKDLGGRAVQNAILPGISALGGNIFGGGSSDPRGSSLSPEMIETIFDMKDKKEDKNPRPDRPEWNSLLDNSGFIKEPYKQQNMFNSGALDQMRTEGMRGPGQASQWRNLQQQQLERQAGDAYSQAQNATNNAMGSLAMRGGLRAGSAERLAVLGARNASQAQQGILGRGLSLDIQDENNRLTGLGKLNSAEMMAAKNAQGINSANIGASLKDHYGHRASNMNNYNEDMRAWAAIRAAQEMPKPDSGGSGGLFGGGGFLGTGIGA